ncbi:TetR/AcrR family transcriptional regulator [Nocardia sp. NPDC050406]|uniref:TetR/AcrR family transcriptional regulator n=1 Tax=Nocardia sp. NPDC050406 TaxID=3364318 RepID=UPI0037A74BC2
MPAKAEQFPTVWARPQRQRRDTPALNQEQIVAEAIALLDSEGLDALSMRRLGTRLNAGATSLYTHVANKEELLELAVDEIFGEVAVPQRPSAESWRADMIAIGHSMRDTLLRHPWMPAVVSTAGLVYLGPNVMRLSDATLEALELAGFSDEQADRAFNALFAYVIGSTTTEAAMLTTVARSGLSERQWVEKLMGAMKNVAADYPRLRKRYAAQEDMASVQSRTKFFESEMHLILDGLESRRG